MAWLMVVLAGALEMVWSYSAKQADGWSNWGWSAVTIVASLISFFLLTFALKTLPLGTAYAAWTGIGAVGRAAKAGSGCIGEVGSAARLGLGASAPAGPAAQLGSGSTSTAGGGEATTGAGAGCITQRRYCAAKSG